MSCFVGVDISKATLDIGILRKDGKFKELKVPNSPAGFARVLKVAREFAVGESMHWCMETTGAYQWSFALFLVQNAQLVSVENPRRIKHYGVVIGAVQKTDRADARVIARYAQAFTPPAWHLREAHLRELVMLDRRISDLDVLMGQERNRLEMTGLPEILESSIHSTIALFKQQRKELEKRINQILEEHEELGEAAQLLSTIPGIATRASVGLLAEAGDLSRYESAEDFAAFFGVNPRIRKSGSSVNGRTRISKAGNAHGRRRLYMPTLVATRVNPHIKEFYERLLAAHKPKKSALIACERKLFMICYGVLKSRKPYDPMHGRLTN